MTISYEIWNVTRLSHYLENSNLKFIRRKGKNFLEGFRYFHTYLLSNIQKYTKEKYNLSNLTQLEIQKDFNSDPLYYARFLVALDEGSKVVGIIPCQWIKDDLPFWRYHLKWVDIREGYKGSGIAKELLKHLDESDFLKGHILQISVETDTSVAFFQKVVDKYLTGKNYALIYKSYNSTLPPNKVGIYK